MSTTHLQTLPLKIKLRASTPWSNSPKRAAWLEQHSAGTLNGAMLLSDQFLRQQLGERAPVLSVGEPFEVRFQQWPLESGHVELQVAVGQGKEWVTFSTMVSNAFLSEVAVPVPTRNSVMPLIEPWELARLWRALTALGERYGHAPLPRLALEMLEEVSPRSSAAVKKPRVRKDIPKPSQFCTFQVDYATPGRIAIERRKVKSAASEDVGGGVAIALGVGVLVMGLAFVIGILSVGSARIMLMALPVIPFLGLLIRWLSNEISKVKTSKFEPITVTVDDSRLVVRSLSLPAPIMIPRGKLAQFFATYDQRFVGDSDSLDDHSVSHLNVELDNGERLMLVSDITNPPDVFYIKEVLEIFLEIEPRPIVGEWLGFTNSSGGYSR